MYFEKVLHYTVLYIIKSTASFHLVLTLIAVGDGIGIYTLQYSLFGFDFFQLILDLPYHFHVKRDFSTSSYPIFK